MRRDGGATQRVASQRKAISTVEEQILLLQRQIMRLDAQMSELRGG